MDCAKALELLKSAACSESKSVKAIMTIKLLMRRGTAACSMGQFADALIDFHEANSNYMNLSGEELSRLNGVSLESLQADIDKLKKLHSAGVLKEEGDSLFAEAMKEKALAKYNEALSLVPVHVSCLSNRSACKLAMGDLLGCVQDCSVAISLLQHDPSQRTLAVGDGPLQMISTILPPVGSEKRTAWMVKTLTRRGVALVQLANYDDAVTDFSKVWIILFLD